MNKKETGKSNKKKEAMKVRNSQQTSPQYETMSQQQNRHGKGRQQSGSDGSGSQPRGSNH